MLNLQPYKTLENEQYRFQLFIKRHILHKHFQFINQI